MQRHDDRWLYLIVIEHEYLCGSCYGELDVGRSDTIAYVDAHGLEQRGEEKRKVLSGRRCGGQQHLGRRDEHQIVDS